MLNIGPSLWVLGFSLQQKTGYSCALDDLHLSGTHLEWQDSVPWGPQKAGHLQFHLWVLSVGKRLPDESGNSVISIGLVYLLH